MRRHPNRPGGDGPAVAMRSKWSVVIVSAVTVCLLAIAPGAALAKGGGHVQSTTSACSVSPGSVAVGGSFTVTASGLPANHLLNLNELYPSFTRTLIMGSGNGSVSATDSTLQDWGTATGQAFTVKLQINDVTGKRPVTLETCSLSVT